MGKLKDYAVHVHIDSNVKPVIQPLWRPPFSLTEKIEDKLLELESKVIIEKVDRPSQWVSPNVVVPKSNGDGAHSSMIEVPRVVPELVSTGSTEVVATEADATVQTPESGPRASGRMRRVPEKFKDYVM